MACASLLHLPAEIQTQIISNLIPFSSTVQSLLLTCKTLYEVALPLSVNLYVNCDYVFTVNSSGGYHRSRSRNLQFLRYITLIKPELARHVKSIIVGDYSTYDCDSSLRFETDGPLPDEREVFEELVEKIYPTGQTGEDQDARDEWLEDLDAGVEDAEVCLLLVACHNLEQLVIGEPYYPRNFERLLRKASDPNQTLDESICPLQKLKLAYSGSAERDYGSPISQYYTRDIFRLPHIRSYGCRLLEVDNESGDAFQTMPHRSSSVEEIILRGGCVTPLALSSLVGACKALRSLGYFQSTLWLRLFEKKVSPQDLLEILLPHAESLEHLHVHFRPEMFQEDGPIGIKLRDLKALKTIKAGMQDLTGISHLLAAQQQADSQARAAIRLTECLPPNLEYLEIRGCGMAIVPLVQELLDMIAGRHGFSKLNRIRLLFNAGFANKDDVQLTYPQALVRLDVGFQSSEDRHRDLDSYSQFDDAWLSPVWDRIFPGESRQRWPRWR